MAMKKWIAVLACSFTLLSMASCGGDPPPQSSVSTGQTTAESAAATQGTDVSSPSQATQGGSTQAGQTTSSGGGKTTAPNASEPAKTNPPSTNPSDEFSQYGIKSGTKGVEEGLNLSGKTVKMAVFETARYTSAAFKRAIKAFEAEYGCTVKLESYAFGDPYTNQVLAKIASKDPYDIIYLHYSQFYNMLEANALEPITDYVTTADFAAAGSTKGLDFSKSKEFSWKNKIYGLLNYYSANPMIIFYNKRMFTRSGLEDPRELYEKGQWTWDKFIEMGMKVTEASSGKYFGGYNFLRKEIAMTNGTRIVENVNGKPTLMLNSNAYVNALKLIQKMGYGEQKVVNFSSEDPLPAFYNGETYVYTEESDRYISITSKIGELSAFGKNKSNLGVVPLPLGSDNKTGVYPTGWLEGVCISKGAADPRIAVAWAKFYANYDDPVNDINSMSSEDQAMIDKLLSNILPVNYLYEDSSSGIVNDEWFIQTQLAQGADMGQLLSQFTQSMQKQIDTTMARMEKVG